MSYEKIDPIINNWARINGLSVYSQHQDSEVRSIDISSPEGKRFQIWIDQPIENNVEVHAWDYQKRRRDWYGSIQQLNMFLDEAIEIISFWMNL